MLQRSDEIYFNFKLFSKKKLIMKMLGHFLFSI